MNENEDFNEKLLKLKRELDSALMTIAQGQALDVANVVIGIDKLIDAKIELALKGFQSQASFGGLAYDQR